MEQELEELAEHIPDKVTISVPGFIPRMVKSPKFIPAVVGVAGVAIGFGVGYVIAKRRYEDCEIYVSEPSEEIYTEDVPFEHPVIEDTGEFEKRVERVRVIQSPIEDIPFYSTLELEMDAISSIEDDELLEAIRELGDEDVDDIQNVFARYGDWDYKVEKANRDSTEPYVIHLDEFVANEMDYDQEGVTYYAGDEIVADRNNSPIYDHERLLGDLKWGHGSGDPQAVYIRNEMMEKEWEILYHEGRYEVEVLGLEIEQRYEREDELRHSSMRFRDD